jgi:hypothetical protein
MRLNTQFWALPAFIVLALAPALHAQALPTASSGGSTRSRSDLESLLVEYQQLEQSPAYSEDLKAEARSRAAQIRERLQEGDFRLGDAVVLFVQNEPTLPDTISVQSSPEGPVITLPVFGEIALRGVLRSELEAQVTETLSRFIRDPVVRAEGLMRLSVQGAVGQPGFYVVPADMLVSEALMAAGGPAQNADLEDMRIERGPDVLLQGSVLQEELRLGTTLDQLNLQAGDQLVLPADTGGFIGPLNLGVVLGLVSTVTFIIFRTR